MVNTILVFELLVSSYFGQSCVVGDQIENVCWIMFGLEAHNFKMIIFESHEVLSPSCLSVSNQAITLQAKPIL